MIDTGSSTTALNPGDLRGVDLTGLGPEEPVALGYGGPTLGRETLAHVLLEEPGVGVRVYQVAILLFTAPELRSLPSVLGRDILRNFRMVYDPSNELLDLKPWRSDDFVPA